MATLIDSWSESNAYDLIYFEGVPKHGQSFINLDKDYNISSCKFYMYRTATVSGTLTAKLYAHSGTYGNTSIPTGTPLATSSAVSASGLPTSLELVEFTFATPYKMIANTNYVIMLEYSGTSGANVQIVRGAPGRGGNYIIYSDETTTYSPNNGRDLVFYVYGNIVANSSAFFQFFMQQ